MLLSCTLLSLPGMVVSRTGRRVHLALKEMVSGTPKNVPDADRKPGSEVSRCATHPGSMGPDEQL